MMIRMGQIYVIKQQFVGCKVKNATLPLVIKINGWTEKLLGREWCLLDLKNNFCIWMNEDELNNYYELRDDVGSSTDGHNAPEV